MAEDADFTDAFCEFLQHSVTAIEAAELLLVLHEDPARAWMPEELVERLRPNTTVSEADVGRHLEMFQARGLVERAPDGRVSYKPASDEIDGYVATLARLYNERPVTLIRVIYALRDTRIKSFADAFKFRK